MSSPLVQVRFVGMLSCARAEALARARISGLGALCGGVAGWDVSLQPPRSPWLAGGYAVRAQARLHDGSVLAIRAQGSALEATVHDAFEGLHDLLLQEGGAAAPSCAWCPTGAGDVQALAA